MKINILFTKKNGNSMVFFELKKKMVNQDRLNSGLIKQILDNKSKIKKLKKLLTKIDKTIIKKNDSIDKLNQILIKL